MLILIKGDRMIKKYPESAYGLFCSLILVEINAISKIRIEFGVVRKVAGLSN